MAARAGLWGNHGYEACYDLIYADADGELLDGTRAYQVTFDPPPPVDAFWSLTMYDVPRFYLVDNPIDRYSLGDRSPGLQYGDDGSVTIYLQADVTRTRSARPTGCRPRPRATSARSCAATSPARRSRTAPTRCRSSSAPTPDPPVGPRQAGRETSRSGAAGGGVKPGPGVQPLATMSSMTWAMFRRSSS